MHDMDRRHFVGACAAAVLAGCGPRSAPRRAAPPTTLGACGGTPRLSLAPAANETYFGVNLDWDHDSPATVASRLGRGPALYVAFAPFPLEGSAAGYIDSIAAGLVAQRAALMLTLEPNDGLGSVTRASAGALAGRAAAYNRDGVPVFLRFAHEMNGSWYAWGQQPTAYIEAFRTVAAAVHAAAPATAMVWAPSYGGGYPFTGGKYAAQPGPAVAHLLDTDGDGTLSMHDDPYLPYYPGDDVVDWVGMSLYHWGSTYPWGNNQLPEPGKFTAMLTGTYKGTIGDQSMLPNFYDVYANRHGKPVAITETAALYAPGKPGDELAIKRAWWQQVFDPATLAMFPHLAMINWFEWDKYETEVSAEVDWAVIDEPSLARAFAASLPKSLLWAGAVPVCGGA